MRESQTTTKTDKTKTKKEVNKSTLFLSFLSLLLSNNYVSFSTKEEEVTSENILSLVSVIITTVSVSVIFQTPAIPKVLPLGATSVPVSGTVNPTVRFPEFPATIVAGTVMVVLSPNLI